MSPYLAATLICLGCHTAASQACETHAAGTGPAAPLRVASATVEHEPPLMRRTASHTPAGAWNVAAAAPSAAVVQPASAAERGHDKSDALWMVGLALIAGIALRRWGGARP